MDQVRLFKIEEMNSAQVNDTIKRHHRNPPEPPQTIATPKPQSPKKEKKTKDEKKKAQKEKEEKAPKEKRNNIIRTTRYYKPEELTVN